MEHPLLQVSGFAPTEKKFTVQQVIEMGIFPDDEVRKAGNTDGIVTLGFMDWES